MLGMGVGEVIERHEHAVYFSDGDDELIEILAGYTVDGLDLGEKVLLVAMPEHAAALDVALTALGRDPDQLRSAGELRVLDARDTLREFMFDGRPDPSAFRRVLGAVLKPLMRDGGEVRIFGQMVRLLWEDGNVNGAILLEDQWNQLAAEYPFTLLCGYEHAVLHETSLADVGQVCALHSTVVPPPSYQMPHTSSSVSETVRATWALLPVPAAIGAFRQFVRNTLWSWGEEALVEDAVLVTSEMATNAISHARSAFFATLVRQGDVVRLSIEDTGPGSAAPRAAGEEDVSGRGLLIVEALADRWGVEERPSGKVVWVELRSGLDRPWA